MALAVLIAGLLSACGFGEKDPTDPCALSQVAVTRTITAITDANTAVHATDQEISAISRYGSPDGKADNALNTAKDAQTKAQNTVNKATKVAANCTAAVDSNGNNAAVSALADAQAALNANQNTLTATSKTLDTAETATEHYHYGYYTTYQSVYVPDGYYSTETTCYDNSDGTQDCYDTQVWVDTSYWTTVPVETYGIIYDPSTYDQLPQATAQMPAAYDAASAGNALVSNLQSEAAGIPQPSPTPTPKRA